MVLLDSSAGQQWRRRHREQTCGLSRGRRGGTNGESSNEMHTLPYANRWPVGSYRPELPPDAGSSNLALCDHLEGRDSVGGGRVAPEGGDIHNTHG